MPLLFTLLFIVSSSFSSSLCIGASFIEFEEVNAPFEFMTNRKMLKVNRTVNLSLTTVSI